MTKILSEDVANNNQIMVDVIDEDGEIEMDVIDNTGEVDENATIDLSPNHSGIRES